MTSASVSLASLGSTVAMARSGGGGNVAVMVTPDGAAITSPDANRPATMGVRSHVGISPSEIALAVAVVLTAGSSAPGAKRSRLCAPAPAGRLRDEPSPPLSSRAPSGPMAPAVSSSMTSRG